MRIGHDSADEPLALADLGLGLIEHALAPMAALEGAAHTIIYANGAFCALMNATSEQIVGRSIQEFLPERDECVELLDRVLRTRRAETHLGTRRPVVKSALWSYTIWPLFAEERFAGLMLQVTETAKYHEHTVAMNEALLLGALRQHESIDAASKAALQLQAEISAHKRTAQSLAERARLLEASKAVSRESEERYRSLFTLAPMAVFVCDTDAVIQQYNARAEELWGRELLQGKERFCDAIKLWRCDGTAISHCDSAMADVLQTGITARNVDVLIERPDGSRVPVLANCAALRDAHGEITGAITAFTDITDRRLLEDTLVARAADLLLADRSKDEFLAMLAHELRNPLAPIRNAAEILSYAPEGSDEREQAHGAITRQIGNMTRMVDDLLDVSRITEGKIELRRQPVAIAEIINSVVESARARTRERRQELTISFPDSPIYVDADATRLEQVFSNLVGNASKYSDPGGHIHLTVEREAGAEPPDVLVRVRDNGIGIAPDVLPRVFELFVQATPAPDRAYGGLGIGLTLVERLVRLHGGSVEARSEGPGLGSEFLVRLPVLPTPASLGAAPILPAAVARDVSRRILVVDDNVDSAGSMATLQRLRGHETRTAFTGHEAVAVAAEFLPEVILLDIGLPGMDGFDVTRTLRAMPELAGAFIVAMTGYGSDVDRAKAKDAGFDEYLIKPVDLDVLRTWLQSRA